MEAILWIFGLMFLVLLMLAFALRMAPADEEVCACKPARFCCMCGKKLSDPKQENLI